MNFSSGLPFSLDRQRQRVSLRRSLVKPSSPLNLFPPLSDERGSVGRNPRRDRRLLLSTRKVHHVPLDSDASESLRVAPPSVRNASRITRFAWLRARLKAWCRPLSEPGRGLLAWPMARRLRRSEKPGLEVLEARVVPSTSPLNSLAGSREPGRGRVLACRDGAANRDASADHADSGSASVGGELADVRRLPQSAAGGVMAQLP